MEIDEVLKLKPEKARPHIIETYNLCQKLQADNRVLLEALEFYADRDNWNSGLYGCKAQQVGSSKAREALNKGKGE